MVQIRKERTLHDGLTVPSIGFGTAHVKGQVGVTTIMSAIENGFRLIDSAFNYENEGAVGEAVRRSSVPREQLVIASKLPGRHHAYSNAVVTIQESLFRARLDYYDIYLIHWPNPKQGLFLEAWQALIDAKRWGLVRSIGVSNFLPEHLDKIINETGVTPSINQNELHPYFSQAEQRAYDDKLGIVTQAWSPFGRGRKDGVLTDTHIGEIAEEYGKTPAQIILRWQLQLGTLPIVKSSSAKRQLENLEVFDFSLRDETMSAINTLTKADGRIDQQNPNEYEEF
ncbi:diketogulonate reductase-like aldo/keto reductase [Alkalihalobacillus xiaoxiensis]|uniref:Diketogulonate reductase-like aldo/keto reductase n=1 Tax=Shouchella xiaoxiensis TaxID=766895 RepID=A0ABS2SUN1_9BACI|nr:aldo/keto reductase [Shouchella xiaoxiensis]MBM7839253.1 diketogulonate reductase-like aldo/keto reductase [Shouchella xiaoxiensis]